MIVMLVLLVLFVCICDLALVFALKYEKER